ncbi:DODA-type extradiol aromatic ring-opening family dioxygenase [Pyxidicoccus sp. MSG2]|uniref:DODA-type extradiol aromatic ring-opening family dioxygenase n=1 Tax=Pyxidicoccus sp. MSG2 TaxID=2996790 RepID=UPI0022719B47|nr:class III extradiol ring-cleavage dioxygenase [Pyxidicoccus sp. MSG2]MCY1020547.1 class III extradiol ring-cleavage dioxygenase [Pyxidicoccus sp. MSG2]
MGDGLDRREVLQGAAAMGVSGVLGAGQAGSRAPAVFVSHGSPMVALDSDDYPKALKTFGDGAAAARALVVVSAHWETEGEVRVTTSATPPLIYDFYGFPEPLYRLKYAAPGAPALAGDVVARLKEAGLPAVADAERGLDHGAWVPLLHAFPDAKLPVVQVSMPLGASPAQVARMGEVMRPLRAQGVLLMGSGGIVHNLRRLNFQEKNASVEPWAQAFDGWVAQKLMARDFSGLQQWLDAPNARLAHPRAEHLMPLYFALGAALPEDRLTPVFEGFHHGTLSMRSFALRA